MKRSKIACLFILFSAVTALNAQEPRMGLGPGSGEDRGEFKGFTRDPATWETPTGPYEVVMEVDEMLPGHTIYRPADLSGLPNGEKLPVVVMSGPGCNFDGDSYRPFWTEVASHGYLVIAIGVPFNGNIIMWHNSADDYMTALDWASSEGERRGSKYYEKIDGSNVALFGQSCGGIQALRVADDPRVKTLVFWNSGSILMGNVGPTDNTKRLNTTSDLMGDRDLRELVTLLRIPIGYFIGHTDMAINSARGDFEAINNAPVLLAVREIPGDSHGGTFREYNGGAFSDVAVAWLDLYMKNDATAAKMFEGASSTISQDPKWVEVQKKNMR